MAVITFPESLAQYVTGMTLAQQRNDMEFRSIFGAQALEVSPPLLAASLNFGPMLEAQSSALQALMMQLRGKTNQLALWNLGRPIPRGTMRGTMALAFGVAQGATTMTITAGASQSGRTLLAGDWIGVGSGLTQQLVMVTANAWANSSGTIAVSFEAPMRLAISAGSAVTWDKPKALFRLQTNKPSWDYAGGMVTGGGLDLLEDARP